MSGPMRPPASQNLHGPRRASHRNGIPAGDRVTPGANFRLWPAWSSLLFPGLPVSALSPGACPPRGGLRESQDRRGCGDGSVGSLTWLPIPPPDPRALRIPLLTVGRHGSMWPGLHASFNLISCLGRPSLTEFLHPSFPCSLSQGLCTGHSSAQKALPSFL